jgi:hypothetical protein
MRCIRRAGGAYAFGGIRRRLIYSFKTQKCYSTQIMNEFMKSFILSTKTKIWHIFSIPTHIQNCFGDYHLKLFWMTVSMAIYATFSMAIYANFFERNRMKKLLFCVLMGALCFANACSEDNDSSSSDVSFNCNNGDCTCEGTGKSGCMFGTIYVCKDGEITDTESCGDNGDDNSNDNSGDNSSQEVVVNCMGNICSCEGSGVICMSTMDTVFTCEDGEITNQELCDDGCSMIQNKCN